MEKLFWRSHYLSPWCFQVCYKNRAERFSSPKILRLKNKLQDKLEIDNNHLHLYRIHGHYPAWKWSSSSVSQCHSRPNLSCNWCRSHVISVLSQWSLQRTVSVFYKQLIRYGLNSLGVKSDKFYISHRTYSTSSLIFSMFCRRFPETVKGCSGTEFIR